MDLETLTILNAATRASDSIRYCNAVSRCLSDTPFVNVYLITCACLLQYQLSHNIKPSMDPNFSFQIFPSLYNEILSPSPSCLGFVCHCRCPRIMVERNLCGTSQSRWSIPSQGHRRQQHLAVSLALLPFPEKLKSISFYRPLPIDVNSTDSLILHVTNSLDQATSIHHHGMFFNSTTWMDGTDGITEWYLTDNFFLTIFFLTSWP
jgi:hypothetical protein